jgi:hypothetical protein
MRFAFWVGDPRLVLAQIDAAQFVGRRVARTGMAAILSSSRWSHRILGGWRGAWQWITSSGVTIRSTRKSWSVSGSGSSMTCKACTVVTRAVRGPIRPASCSSATSMSEKPPPLPRRAPLRLTATLPQTTRSTGRSSATATLRKGREDNKNEPGAADFYYGEMEMRRHAPNTPTAERLLLGLYWLCAGYALRSSRALATLPVVLASVTVLLALWGLPTSSTPTAANLKKFAPSSDMVVAHHRDRPQ